MKKNNIQLFAKIALFGAALIWGSSFFVMKNAVDAIPTFYLLAFRFIVGCFILSGIFYKKLKKINQDYIIKGAIIGLFLFLAYSIQTIGLIYTTPGKNAFLTALYCVIVPFLFWAVNRTRPDIYNFSAAILCITGIGLVSLTQNLSISIGDFLTLVCSFFYAAHLVCVAKFSKNNDPIIFTILQFAFAGGFALIAAFFFEQFPTHIDSGCINELIYLAVFSTAIALLLQNIGQKYTNPSAASIILSLESVFGVLFSILFYGETVNGRLILGFLFIFVAILVSETKLSFLKKNKKINNI